MEEEKEEEIKDIQIGKKEIRLLLFASDPILIIENTSHKNTTKTLNNVKVKILWN